MSFRGVRPRWPPPLHRLGHTKVSIRVGDGSRGWAERAPFDKVLVAAGAERVPPALLGQLKPGGRLVLPLGAGEAQWLTVVDKGAGDGPTRVREVIPVRSKTPNRTSKRRGFGATRGTWLSACLG